MTRTPLDLRDKTMTELQGMDAEVGNRLDTHNMLAKAIGYGPENTKELLADRRQIRAAMAAIKGV